MPKVTSRNKNLPVWFDSAVKHLLNCVRSLRKRLSLKPSIAKIYKLTVLESKLQESIQISKQVYITNLLSSFNTKPGHLYRHLHRLIKPDLSPQFIIHNSTPIYNSDMCEIFNNYFHSTFMASNYTLPSIHELPSPPSQLSSINLDPFNIYTLLSNLDPTKACGSDELDANYLNFVLCHFMNLFHTFSTSVYNVLSSHKSGKLTKFVQYPKKGTYLMYRITDLFHFFVLYLKCLKEQFMIRLSHLFAQKLLIVNSDSCKRDHV